MSTSSLPDLNAIPAPPMDEDGPVFSEPWQAQAFAMTVTLFEAGHFTWPEWAQYLGAAVAAGKEDEDAGRKAYYDHWLAALERIISDKGLANADELDGCRLAWKKAYQRTPHGEAVELSRGMA